MSFSRAFGVSVLGCSGSSAAESRVADVFFPLLLEFFVEDSLLVLVTLPARVMFPCSLLLALDLGRPFCNPAGFLATFFLESREPGCSSQRASGFCCFAAFFAFCRGLTGASFSLLPKLAVFVSVLFFFFFVTSLGTLGEGKNREREGSWNSSDGDGNDGGDAASGGIPITIAGSYVDLAGVRCGGFGEEDRMITSAELVMVASDAFGLFLVVCCCRVSYVRNQIEYPEKSAMIAGMLRQLSRDFERCESQDGLGRIGCARLGKVAALPFWDGKPVGPGNERHFRQYRCKARNFCVNR